MLLDVQRDLSPLGIPTGAGMLEFIVGLQIGTRLMFQLKRSSSLFLLNGPI